MTTHLFHRMGKLRLKLLLSLAFVFSAAQPRLAAQAPPPLTSVAAIRALTTEQARQGRPVLLHGVVTVLSGWKSSFFFQDKTFGISVDRSSDTPVLAPSDEVELRGITAAGLFAPIVVEQSVTVLGKGKLPSTQVYGPVALAGGRQDSQYIAVRGIVRQAEVKTSWGRPVLFLTVGIGAGNLVTARVHDFEEADVKRFVGALVKMEGVCGTVFNDKRQFTGTRLFVANTQDITIERPASSPLFGAPLVPLHGLMQFGSQEDFISRVRVQGVVTYSGLGKDLYIQKGEDGLLIENAQASHVPIGTEIEAVGYPAQGEYSPKLVSAVYRIIPTTDHVTPLQTSARDMVVVKDGFPSGPYDSTLVRTAGKLIDEIRSQDGRSLVLQDGAVIFTAKVPREANEKASPPVGSLLRVTGICAIDADENHEAKSFSILLRSASDVSVVKRASWWTASHALYVVGVLLFAVIALTAWALILRRQSDLREQAVTDPLTGVYNRRGFLLLAQQQWQISLRRKIPLLLFYVDVDKFKEINDTFGHKQGDIVLKSVAALLQECFRKVDIIGRLGGDEFAVAALDAPGNTQQMLEDRIAGALRQANEKEQRPFTISLSIGVLECDVKLGAVSIEGLLERADGLMYEKKRNRKSGAMAAAH